MNCDKPLDFDTQNEITNGQVCRQNSRLNAFTCLSANFKVCEEVDFRIIWST